MLRLAALTPFRFRIAVVVLLAAAFALLQVADRTAPSAAAPAWERDDRLHVFFHPDCPHCHRAIAFLAAQPDLAYDLHDTATASGHALLLAAARSFGVPDDELGVPMFVRGDRYLIGFESAGATGPALRALATGSLAGSGPPGEAAELRLPLLGTIDPARYSLPLLTVVMGLADGFNPCAMWVLVYLISLIAGLQDRAKIWWLVGTFVVASGAIYFLLMTAWLNAFMVLGYIRPLTQLVGLTAIGFGADHLYRLAVSRGVIVCEVGDFESRQRTMRWARRVVLAPVGLVSLVLMVGLAFTVNAIEFACSAALPAVYAHTLALTGLPPLAHYGYIALYVAFFMLDDLVVFGLAAFAVQKAVDTRYAAFSRGAGGAVLLGLGLWMLLR